MIIKSALSLPSYPVAQDSRIELPLMTLVQITSLEKILTLQATNTQAIGTNVLVAWQGNTSHFFAVIVLDSTCTYIILCAPKEERLPYTDDDCFAVIA